jgi:arylsulfatase A-like enzyme
MNRRDLIKLGGALTAGSLAAPLLAGQAPAVQARRKRRPNILLIVTDQERSFLDLPEQLSLPAHEALRASGVSLGNYHVNTTPCSPSRSVIFTGQHTQQTLMVANHGLPPFNDLSPELPTLGHMLREQGYTTAYKGKWHLSHVPGGDNLTYGVVETSEQALQAYGFADYNLGGDPHGTHLTGFLYDRLTASDAARWMQAHKDDEAPWLLAVNFVNPHDVMFYSSGPEQERSRLRQKGPHMYKENTRVNFIVRHPDLPRGVQRDALGSSVDLVPTLLELAGVSPEQQQERYPQLAGVSLCESLGGASGRSQRDALGHLFRFIALSRGRRP